MRKSEISMDQKIKVVFFQRRPRQGFSFSLEYIFDDIRNRLKNKIDAEIKISKYFNDGYFTKFYNIVEAGFRQGKSINHITGEMHFLNLLMNRKRNILTILDCGMMERKTGLAKVIVKWLYLTLPIKKTRFITAISEITKQQIIYYTNCPASLITVIPVAVDPIFKPQPKVFNQTKTNILHIGTGPNKNLFRLIEALDGINCELTIIGKLGDEMIEKLKRHSIEYNNAVGISQAELLQKYLNCDILAFISTFEGFGMPIIEANCIERVVLTSNISSMPEVAGNAACLVDPYDVDDIRKGILKLISNEPYRTQLIENGKKNRLRFDGEKIAASYFELYQKVISNN